MPIAQTSVAAGLACCLARSLAGHIQPFFAPVAVAVTMGTTRELRGWLAVQLVAGWALGVMLGLGVQALLGAGAVSLGVAVFLALCVALLVGHHFIPARMTRSATHVP